MTPTEQDLLTLVQILARQLTQRQLAEALAAWKQATKRA